MYFDFLNHLTKVIKIFIFLNIRNFKLWKTKGTKILTKKLNSYQQGKLAEKLASSKFSIHSI